MVFSPSVTSKRTARSLPRTTLPGLTRPPSRMRLPGATCFSTTSLGELKKTIESLSALSTSATATASTPSAEPIKTKRRRLRVIAAFLDLSSTLEAQSLDQLVDLAELSGFGHERASRVAGCGTRFVALAQHHIGAHQSQPPLEIGAV